MNNVIHCQNLDELIAICAKLVPYGVTFSADTHTFTITLTGGY